MATGLTLPGPTGPVHGAIRVQEHPADGNLEDKIFAPGYGEFIASVPASEELVSTAVSVPTDEAPGEAPAGLDRLDATASALFRDGATQPWTHLTALVNDARRAWTSVESGPVPPLLAEQTSGVLDSLDAAVAQRSRSDLRQAAVKLTEATLDLQMQYEDVADVDEGRIVAWGHQELLDQAAGNVAGVRSDRVIIKAIEDRVGG